MAALDLRTLRPATTIEWLAILSTIALLLGLLIPSLSSQCGSGPTFVYDSATGWRLATTHPPRFDEPGELFASINDRTHRSRSPWTLYAPVYTTRSCRLTLYPQENGPPLESPDQTNNLIRSLLDFYQTQGSTDPYPIGESQWTLGHMRTPDGLLVTATIPGEIITWNPKVITGVAVVYAILLVMLILILRLPVRARSRRI